MKKLCVVLGALILGGCVVVVDEQGGVAAVRVPTVVVAAPKLQVIAGLQGVYYAPGNPNVLFHNGRWWRYHGGRWYHGTRFGHWAIAPTAIVPRIFLSIPSWHAAHRRFVVNHPKYRKPAVAKPRTIIKPKVRTPVVKPRIRGGVVKPAKPLRPRVVRPGKPAKPAKPAKPEKEKEKEKEKSKAKGKGLKR